MSRRRMRMRGRLAALLAAFGVLPALAAAPSQPMATPRAAGATIAREYAAAEQAFQDGDFKRAEQLYSALIKEHGNEPTAWFRVGLMEQRRQAFKPALYAYDNALDSAAGETTDEIAQVLAKVRFNRALLLLQSAAQDLEDIAPGALDANLDGTRQLLSGYIAQALRVADAPAPVPAPARRSRHAVTTADEGRAKGYIYEDNRGMAKPKTIEGGAP